MRRWTNVCRENRLAYASVPRWPIFSNQSISKAWYILHIIEQVWRWRWRRYKRQLSKTVGTKWKWVEYCLGSLDATVILSLTRYYSYHVSRTLYVDKRSEKASKTIKCENLLCLNAFPLPNFLAFIVFALQRVTLFFRSKCQLSLKG